MTRLLAAILMLISLCAVPAYAQDSALVPILAEHSKVIQKGSRKTIQPAIDAIAGSGIAEAQRVLELWQAKELWVRKSDGRFFRARKIDTKTYQLIDLFTGAELETVEKKALKQIKPNSGVRSLIGAALVRFQLAAPEIEKRIAALDAIERRPEASHLSALRGATDDETDPDVRARKLRLERLLTVRFGASDAERIAAIQGFVGDLGVDARAALNPLAATELRVSAEAPAGPEVARILAPGQDLQRDAAYALLVEKGLAPPRIDRTTQREVIVAHVEGGAVGGIPVEELGSTDARNRAYAELVRLGAADAAATEAEIDAALAGHTFYEAWSGAPVDVAMAARTVLTSIDRSVWFNQMIDLALDALSLGSIYFLAAIGLAITFGVMRVINMNRPGFTGEFFVQNLSDFIKVVHACIEGVLHFLRRPVTDSAV